MGQLDLEMRGTAGDLSAVRERFLSSVANRRKLPEIYLDIGETLLSMGRDIKGKVVREMPDGGIVYLEDDVVDGIIDVAWMAFHKMEADDMA